MAGGLASGGRVELRLGASLARVDTDALVQVRMAAPRESRLAKPDAAALEDLSFRAPRQRRIAHARASAGDG
eukprot:568145-Pleurochrysis_carterae.AAC.1